MKKILIGLGVVVVIIIGYFLLTEPIAIEEASQRGRESSGEYFVYESDAESADECTSYEYFDEEASVCAFECETEEECAEIEDSIDAELDEWGEGEYTTQPQSEDHEDMDSELTETYVVTKGEKVEFNGKTTQYARDIWQHISRISPDTLSNQFIETYAVYDNPENTSLAFVDDSDMNGRWRIAVNIAGYKESNLRERNLTLVHELGHIVTLNMNQVKNISESQCKFYFTAEGCANNQSYLGGFVNSFWDKSMINSAAGGNSDLYREGKFVTEYAASNPEEDLAESFAYYIVGGKRDGNTVEDKKVNYFAQFPEIVSMRDEMLTGIRGDIIRARQAR
jgi:hypothetical protein